MLRGNRSPRPTRGGDRHYKTPVFNMGGEPKPSVDSDRPLGSPHGFFRAAVRNVEEGRVIPVLGLALFLLVLPAIGLAILIRRGGGGPDRRPVYVIEDAIDHATANLDREILDRIGRDGVRRMIEWSTHYLQGLAAPGRRRSGLRVVAGGDGAAIEYIGAELARRGYDYSHSDIGAVLAEEAGYLAGIGVLGARVEEGERA